MAPTAMLEAMTPAPSGARVDVGARIEMSPKVPAATLPLTIVLAAI